MCDSQILRELLDATDQGQEIYADNAYTGKGTEEISAKYQVVGRVIEKGYKNRTLTETQKKRIEKNPTSGQGLSIYSDLWKTVRTVLTSKQ